ncbi:hypothetical protein HY441_02525 [Candidatus Microgenomates bacterium]|nr:hypothetical protein [Candidatus Microgenomates bacterium]
MAGLKKLSPIPQHQQGLGALVIIAIVAVSLAVVAAAAFYALKRSNSSLLPAKYRLNSNCQYNDAELCRFINNFEAVSNFSVKTSGQNPDGTTSETTLLFDGDDKSQLIMSIGGKESLNTITIGKTIYTKDYSDGKWYKYTEPSDQSDQGQTSSFKEELKDDQNKTTFKSQGKEKCDGRNCFKYQVITEGQDATQYIWFDDRDYLLRKVRIETQDGASEQTYDYAKVTISEPSPTKDTPPSTIPGLESLAPETVAPSDSETPVPDLQMPEVPYGDE